MRSQELNDINNNANQFMPDPLMSSIKSQDSNHLLYSMINDLKSQFQELRTSMSFEVDVLRQKITILEQSNKYLRDIQEQIIDNQRNFLDAPNHRFSMENIDDEYKSKKRQINELSINLDVPPTLHLNLKQLSSQNQTQLQLLKDLKKEMNDQYLNKSHTIQKVNDKMQEQKQHQQQQQQHTLHNQKHHIPAKNKSREHTANIKRPITSLRDPKQQKAYQNIISPHSKYEDTDLESTLQVGLLNNKANTPIESPNRSRKGGFLNQQDKASITSSSKYSIVVGMTLSDKLQGNNILSHLQKQTLANYKNKGIISQVKENKSHNQSQNQSTIGLNKSSVKKPDQDDQSQNRGLDQSSIIDSPKFLNFINSNTTRKQEDQQSNNLAQFYQPKVQSTTNQNSSLHHSSVKFQPSQPSDVMDNYQDEDHEIITERAIKINMNDPQQILLQSSGRLSSAQNIIKVIGKENHNQKQTKNPLLKNYMNSKPQNLKQSINNDIDDEESIASDECDEKRSYTPEPRHLEKLANKSQNNLNHSMIGIKGSLNTSMSGMIPTGGVNSVYKSSKMELSRYISKHKSNVDYQNKYNVMEFGGYKALIEQKGSKCQCKINGYSDEKTELQDIPKNACGNYCKLLGAREQRHILLECYQKELEKPPTEKKLKRYLIDARWIRKWCDFTNFDTSIMSNCFSVSTKTLIQDMLEDLQQQQSERTIRFDSSTLYQKPQKIDNNELLDHQYKGNIKRLRENLVENYDFLSVSPLIWMHLYSWYSADFQIARYMKRDKFNTNQYTLELYPHQKQEKLNLSYMGPQQDSSESESEIDQTNNNRQFDSPTLELRQRNVTQTILQSKDQISISNRMFQHNIGKKMNKLSNKSQEFISLNDSHRQQ
ncbi:ubiquitin carboxyl-terminal hydrolase [Stylonychia lemnae]|uniref:Ubiquitin carboxyl-terminal hydrolase n=1 Tax=Stylonychia lemnae TaxID=5949 RepID=A0A078AUJ8_STYLE|nr:ubiquitin carboxyl-terminal hydrolase [Stylonychia lemnae]|eukprot:CDW84553.1 ubiquitin carboxyl-terminal hydrolase [Stylonychia lemnae]